MNPQKTLTILRHAKADAAQPGEEDHARALSPRGILEAQSMGQYLAKSPAPQLVLCSGAKRTRQTFEQVAASFPAPLNVEYHDEIYLAAPKPLLQLLARAPQPVERLLLIGHNPGLHELAIVLARLGDEKQRRLLAQKFPPCALAEMEFNMADWKDILRTPGTLLRFVTPENRPP